MRNIHKIKVLFMATTVMSLLLFTQCTDVTAPEKVNTDLPDQVMLATQGNGNLDDVEKADLLYMREEEKLARDMYNFLYETWGTPIFAQIVPSEERHMEALKRLIDKHKMTEIDPVVLEPDPGEFVNEKIQALYDFLEEKGILSETDALEVGKMVEDIDIEDLLHFMTRVDNDDIYQVYGKICDASYLHQAAFEGQLPSLSCA